MPSNARLPRTSVRLDTTYKSWRFSAVIGEKAYPLTVATYVSDIETRYPYALAVRQLLAVHHYLPDS